MSNSFFRVDIQLLRGFAVLIVVLYHAKAPFLPAGYLGVDIFFVISGFVITGLIVRELDARTFSFGDFYFRRAKRLLPAAYVTLLITALAAPFFLTSSAMTDFRDELLGAVTFTANIVLWKQSGYFENAADFKPLLHFWSLALEEQYYMILPAALVFVPRRFWKPVCLIGFSASLLLCVALKDKPGAQFFLLPTRAWELLLGTAASLLQGKPSLQRTMRWLAPAALAGLLAMPLARFGSHPGPQALVACFFAFVVLLRAWHFDERNRAVGVLRWVGDISYSLYLVHWPLMAFFSHAWIGQSGQPQPVEARALLVVASFATAWALYSFVERPMRAWLIRPSASTLARTAGVSLLLMVLAVALAASSTGDKDYEHAARANVGFGLACDSQGVFQPTTTCANSSEPQVLVWGDSFAMHLVAGLAQDFDVVQATRSACAPLKGMSVLPLRQDEHWARSCIAFNDSVLAYAAQTPSIRTVVISSPFYQQVDPGEINLDVGVTGTGSRLTSAGVDSAAEGLRRSVNQLRALGKEVVIVAPPPNGGFDIARCVERNERGLLTLAAPPGCEVQTAVYHRGFGQVLKMLGVLAAEGIRVESFDALLCDAKVCRTTMDGTLLYRDKGHLSYDGSRLLVARSGLSHLAASPRVRSN